MPDGSITSRDVLEELREFRKETNDRFATIQTTLSSMATTVAVEQTRRQSIESTVADHDKSIRSLLRWRWWLAGAVAASVVLGVAGGDEVVRLVAGG